MKFDPQDFMSPSQSYHKTNSAEAKLQFNEICNKSDIKNYEPKMNLRNLLSMIKNVLEDPMSVHEEYCKSQQNKQNI